MTAQDVPREKWASFCDTFTRLHKDWLATVEVVEGWAGDSALSSVLVRNVVLLGITMEMTKETETLSIMVGREPGERLTHSIVSPAKIRLAQSEDQDHGALEVVSSNGEITVIEFRSKIFP